MNIFNRSKVAPAPTPTDAAPPPAPTEGAPAGEAKGPLDNFNFLVQNKPADDGNGPPAIKIDKAAQALTPETLNKLVGQLDFTQHISQDSIEKLRNGDSSGMMNAFNEMLRAAVGQAAQLNANLGDMVMDNRLTSFQDGLRSNIRAELTAQEQSTIPGYENPVVQESLKGIADRIRQAHPDASPKEVAAMSREYFISLASVLNPDSKTPEKNVPSTDWIEFANS